MAERIPGGRPHRVNGLKLSDEENEIIERARKRLKPTPAKAEFIRDAAYQRAIDILADRPGAGESEITPDDLADPSIREQMASLFNNIRTRRVLTLVPRKLRQ